MLNLARYLMIFATLFGTSALAADGDGSVTHQVGAWKVDCSTASCKISTFDTRGAYRSVITEMESPAGDLGAFAFFVGGDVDSKTPLTFQFAHVVLDKSKQECAKAPDPEVSPDCYNFDAKKEDAFSGPFTACQGGVCISKISGDGGTGATLLPLFKGFEFLLLVYKDSKGAQRYSALDIRGYGAAYDTALDALRKAH